ncbi:MAG: CHAT domain-containing protein [Cyanobacteria bacterium P01_D01_bin.1]
MIQEFGLSITAVGDDQYWVRTERVAKGVQLAEEKVQWPVADWLEQAKSLMHDPLLGLLKGQQNRVVATRPDGSSSVRSADDTNLITLVHLGKTLHNELFRGQLRDSWVAAQGVAHHRQDLLRLRIGIKDSRLQQLPWEALHAGTRPLATGTDVIFSRYILNRHQVHSNPAVQSSAAGQVLRILMVIAAPNDQERLELKQEVHHLQLELHPRMVEASDSSVDVQLKILEQPGRAELTQELERGNYQALHYAGHSNLGNAGGDLYLVSRQTGLTERLSGEDLAGLLVNNGVKLAVFNSCRGGYSSGSDEGWQERNLAQALVNRGMPAVIAMTERIPDHVAITFTQLLYRNLKKGLAIDLSLNRTRQGLISAYGSHQFYWVLPTLYMHPLFDGYLVKTKAELENTRLLDTIADPFGDMFSDLGLPDMDLSIRTAQKVPTTQSVAIAMRSTSPTEPMDVSDSGTSDITASDRRSQHDIEEPLTALSNETVVKEVSTSTVAKGLEDSNNPSALASRKKSTGFYMEPTADSSTASVTASAEGLTNSPQSELPKLVGERLSRSHTLHTKILTVPGAITLGLIALSGITAVTWLNRSQPRSAPVENVSGLSLPTRVDLAFQQDDLDEATVAIKALIDNNQFSDAITALQSANQTQQQDAIIAFLKGRAQWGLVKQNNSEYSVDDVRRSWVTALESESDWMEITMALGFAQYASGLDQAALDSWQRALELADRQSTDKGAYFSDQTFGEYALNAQAGVAIAALSLADIETDPAEKELLLKQAASAYRAVITEAPAEFNANTLGANWLWIEGAIADWEAAKATLSDTIEIE